MKIPIRLARALIAGLAVLPALACDSEESKQMKKLAGTYVKASHDTSYAALGFNEELTLRPDGRWVRAASSGPVFGGQSMVDSGSYRANGATIAIRFGEGPTTYVVRGDTLAWSPEERERMMGRVEAVTGMKVTGQVETFYVRMRDEPSS